MLVPAFLQAGETTSWALGVPSSCPSSLSPSYSSIPWLLSCHGGGMEEPNDPRTPLAALNWTDPIDDKECWLPVAALLTSWRSMRKCETRIAVSLKNDHGFQFELSVSASSMVKQWRGTCPSLMYPISLLEGAVIYPKSTCKIYQSIHCLPQLHLDDVCQITHLK